MDRDLDEPRYSTPELLSLERGLIEQAERRATEQTAVVAGEHVRAALAARQGLDGDQAAMVRQVTGDGAGISLVVGYAGSGKTYATGAAVDAFRRQGLQVMCTAPTGAAARELERETNAPAPTIDSLLGQLHRGAERLDRHMVVVVDEAAMVGTRNLAQLLGHADRAGSKVVMIGDDRQAPSRPGALAQDPGRQGAGRTARPRRVGAACCGTADPGGVAWFVTLSGRCRCRTLTGRERCGTAEEARQRGGKAG